MLEIRNLRASYGEFEVLHGVDLTVGDGKMVALQAYLDAGLIEQQELDAHRHLARYRGAEMHGEYAESFEVVWEVQ